MVNATFTSAIGAAAAAKTLAEHADFAGEPLPGLRAARARGLPAPFHEQPEAYALFGYEAMSATLRAIARAGARGNNRQAVIDALFSSGPRDSVIGRYAIEPDGETTLSSYGVDRVAGGVPVFWRELNTG